MSTHPDHDAHKAEHKAEAKPSPKPPADTEQVAALKARIASLKAIVDVEPSTKADRDALAGLQAELDLLCPPKAAKPAEAK